MADYPFWQNIDGQWKQLKRWVLHKVSGTPSGVQEGAFWYNTDNDRVSYLDSSGTKSVANLDDLVDLDAHRIIEDVYYHESATKGDPLYVISGSQPGQIMVARAKSNSDSTMLASYIAMQDTPGGVTAKAIAFGPLDMMGTGSYSVRQKLYVGLTGGLTGTKPYDRAQVVAEVDRVGGNDGILFVAIAKVYDDKVSSAGVISTPPTITRNELAGTVTVGTCRCRLYDNADYQGFPIAYDIPQATLELTDRGDEWIVAEYNGGSPRYILVDAWNFLDYNLSDRVAISNVLRLGNTIHGSDQGMTGNGLIERQALRLGQTNRYSRVGGTGLSLSVSNIPAVRTVKISGAYVWDVLTQQPIFDFDSSVDVFYAVVKNAGVWTYTPVTQWDNLHYNNDNGLEVMGNSKWGVLWIYRSMGNDKEAWMVYGTQQHNSQANANEDVPRPDVERILQSHAQLVGRIVFEQGVDVGTVTSAFSTVFGTGSATNHNNLGGLQGGTANEYYHDTLQQHNWKVNAGSANGYALLDSNGLLPIEKIPASLLGSVRYQGTWNASTNTPTLVNPPNATTKGYYYVVDTAGTQFGTSWSIGDWIISNGSAWQKIDNTDQVSSVFGRQGAVVASNGDYNASQITNTPAGNIVAVTVQAAIDELDTEKAAKATTLAGYGITDASPLNTTLADNAASSTLPTAGSATAITTLLQQIRDNLKSLFAKLTDGSVTKVGKATVGSTSKGIYLNAGVPTAMGSTVGSASQPTFLNAGTVTAITGAIANSTTGNAATATKLATARNIALTGDVHGNVDFDGSANVSITATVADDSHSHTAATLPSSPLVQNSAGYGQWGLVASPGLNGYQGLNIYGSHQIALMSHESEPYCGVYDKTAGKWIIGFDANGACYTGSTHFYLDNGGRNLGRVWDIAWSASTRWVRVVGLTTGGAAHSGGELTVRIDCRYKKQIIYAKFETDGSGNISVQESYVDGTGPHRSAEVRVIASGASLDIYAIMLGNDHGVVSDVTYPYFCRIVGPVDSGTPSGSATYNKSAYNALQADLWDGKHCVVQNGVPSLPDASTIYFIL